MEPAGCLQADGRLTVTFNDWNRSEISVAKVASSQPIYLPINIVKM